ncbi:hypothetical protein EV13_3040 [Prochlorococcus sp. MIT 0702]|nr:hypothetical protein EV12_2985 [Prochlorococcus sp. MIT 0701]KGG26257.1 hypothetical protein EV13_3040 [Prochlorococcus sp. MIT 0702]
MLWQSAFRCRSGGYEIRRLHGSQDHGHLGIQPFRSPGHHHHVFLVVADRCKNQSWPTACNQAQV